MSRTPNDKKLEELILFISQRSLGDKRFGAEKLNEILFFCDFAAYVKLGEAITWHEYQKLGHGPAPRRVHPTLGRLQEERSLALAEHDYFGRRQIRSLALRDADLSLFSPNEIALVTEVIEEFWGKDATEMNDISHQFGSWSVVREGESIPYELALVKTERATDADRRLVGEICEELQSAIAESI